MLKKLHVLGILIEIIKLIDVLIYGPKRKIQNQKTLVRANVQEAKFNQKFEDKSVRQIAYKKLN
jgi:hypothetical protein